MKTKNLGQNEQNHKNIRWNFIYNLYVFRFRANIVVPIFVALPFSHVKERLDFVDFDNFEFKHSLIEGGDLGKKIESASTHFKFEKTNKGESVCKVVTTYKPLPGVENKDEIAKGKKAVAEGIKATEAFLLANPGAYA